MRIHPRMKPVVELAEELGYTVARTRNDHLRFTHPNGALVHTPSTPSDWRSAKNAMSTLKREVKRRA